MPPCKAGLMTPFYRGGHCHWAEGLKDRICDLHTQVSTHASLPQAAPSGWSLTQGPVPPALSPLSPWRWVQLAVSPFPTSGPFISQLALFPLLPLFLPMLLSYLIKLLFPHPFSLFFSSIWELELYPKLVWWLPKSCWWHKEVRHNERPTSSTSQALESTKRSLLESPQKNLLLSQSVLIKLVFP